MTETANNVPDSPLVLPTNPGEIVRSKKDGAFKVIRSKAWGDRFEKCEDPDGKDIDADTIIVPADFPKIPATQWHAWVSLAFHFLKPPANGKDDAPDKESEVSVIFCRKRPDLREWVTFVPRQTVGGASVDANLTELCDLLTGEELTGGLPETLAHSGSSHSHNTMMAFFSRTDDKNELSVPGVHIVIGRLTDENGKRTYVPKASIVQKGKRYAVEFESVVDTNRDEPYIHYHAKCLDYVKKHVPQVSTFMHSTYGVSAEDLEEWSRLFTGNNNHRNLGSSLLSDDDETGTIKLPDQGSVARRKWLETDGAHIDGMGNCWMPDGTIIMADSGETITANKLGSRRTGGKPESKENARESALQGLIPVGLRLSIYDARQAAKLIKARGPANAIRSICNAIEMIALSQDDDAIQTLFQLSSDLNDSFIGETGETGNGTAVSSD